MKKVLPSDLFIYVKDKRKLRIVYRGKDDREGSTAVSDHRITEPVTPLSYDSSKGELTFERSNGKKDTQHVVEMFDPNP
jgi:hypothetical protein